MWRRTALMVALIVLAVALVVVPAVIVITGQTNWGHARLQEAFTRGLADYVQREVAVGRVRGSLLDGFTVDGVAIAEGATLREGAMITARRVRVEYDLWSVLRGRMAPMASIRAVHVYEPQVRVARDVRGRLNLASLLPRLRAQPPEKRFRGQVFVHDGAVVYDDRGPSLVAPLVVRAIDLQLTADLRQVLSPSLAASGRILDGRANRFRAAAQLQLTEPFLNLELALDDLDVPWLAGHFREAAGVRVLGGRADVAGSFYSVKYGGRRRNDQSLTVTMRHLTVASSRARTTPVTLDGRLWIGENALQARGLRATVAGSTYDLVGSASSFKTPVLDLAVTSNAARLQPIIELLPASVRTRVSVPASGVSRLSAQVIGPGRNPDVRLRLDMPAALTVQVAAKQEIRAEGFELNAEAVSATNKPSVRATLTAQRLRVPTFRLGKDKRGQPRDLEFGQARGVRATFQFAGGKPVGTATVQVPWLKIGRFQARELSTRAVLINDLLRLQQLRANVLGGTLAAEASLRNSPQGAGLVARGRVRNTNLQDLAQVPGLESLAGKLSGQADAEFQARAANDRVTANVSFDARDLDAEGVTVRHAQGLVGLEQDKELTGVGRISVRNVHRKDLALDDAAALVRFRGPQVELLSGTGRMPEGQLWARGQVDLKAKLLDLRVQGADLDVGALAARAKLTDVKGVGYASGTLRGPYERPLFDGRISVFGPQYASYQLSALTARAHYADEELALTELMATRRSGIVAGDVTLSHLTAPKSEVMLAGHLTGEGLGLKDLAQLLKREEPVGGLAELKATLSGTLEKPQAQGELRLANATYKEFVVDRATAPFVYADNMVGVVGGEATWLDAPVKFSGTVKLKKTPELDADLSVTGLRLEGLAPYLDVNLPLAGNAAVERLWVRGPTDDLQGEAHITAAQAMIGDETLGDVDATLSLSRGQVQLHETSFDLADGRVIVSGSYDTRAQPHTVAAQVQLQQTNLPDLLYLALPLAKAADGRAPAQRDRTALSLRSVALRVQGIVDGTVNLQGAVDAPAGAVDLVAPRLVLDGRPLPQLSAKARVSKQAVEDLVLVARQGDALINADGDIVFDGPINLNVEGTGITMAQLKPWIPLKAPYGGQLGFTIVASGRTHEPEVMASVDVASPSFAGVQFDVLTVPVATVREGEIDVDTLVIKRGQTEIVLDGRLPFSWHLPGTDGEGPGLIPKGQITMGGRIEHTPVEFFMPLVDEYLRGRRPPAPVPGAEEAFRWASIKTSGSVDSAVSLTGTVNTPSLRGFLKVSDGLVLPRQWSTPVNELKADVQFSGTGRDNLIEVNDLSAKYDGTRGQLRGKVALTGTDWRQFWKNTLDLRLKLDADKQPLPGGTEVTGLHGAVSLRTENGAQVIRPEDLKMTIGGGEAALTGEARLREFRTPRLAENQYNLEFKMAPGRVRVRPFLDAKVRGTLSLITPAVATRAVLAGNWQFTDGVVGLASTAAGVNTFAAFGSGVPAPDLDIVAGLGTGMQLRGSSLKAPLQPNPAVARITGTPQKPSVAGSVVTARGNAMLPTATLRLRNLAVHYFVEPVPGDHSDPLLLHLRGSIDGSAETNVNRPGTSPIHIMVRISGYLPDQVAVTCTSDSGLTEAQIYALLGGVPFSYLPGVGGNEGRMGQVVSEQFLAALGQVFQLRVFQPIEEELQRVLGLDLGITFAFNQAVTLQVGKYVLRNLLITYERPLVENQERFDLRVSYELPHGLRITYHNDERDINQVEVGYSFTF